MGNAKSAPKESDAMVLIGQGATAKVFMKGDKVIKKSKMFNGTDTDTFRELRFFGWVSSLDPSEQVFFSKLHNYKIDQSSFVHNFSYTTEVNEEQRKNDEARNKSKWTIEITSEYKGRRFNDPFTV